jgi:folate-dependent phosphoribosylglycinamide formyltransferase PurN
MRAIVLTSNMRRHNFVANTAASRLDVAGVWQEAKSFQPLRYATSSSDEAAIGQHFAARDASEAQYFADHDRVRAKAIAAAPGGCNEPEAIDAMRRAAPDVVLVFGTGLLKQPLIDAFPGRILNIHLGLSPFYRGAGTNFWPLVNREPEYCGATIHFLDAGVDTGPVIAHVRPEIRQGDGPHDIGNRTIVAAAAMLVDAALALAAGGVAGVPQAGGGRVYKRADFSAEAVNRLYANFADGMIDEYLRDREARDRRVPLVPLAPMQTRERAVP